MNLTVEKLYTELNIAYSEYIQELKRVYGKRAVDAAYNYSLNRATPTLKELYDLHTRASQAYIEYITEMRKR